MAWGGRKLLGTEHGAGAWDTSDRERPEGPQDFQLRSGKSSCIECTWGQKFPWKGGRWAGWGFSVPFDVGVTVMGGQAEG